MACSAPELAPQTDLAGAQPVANGPLIEEQSGTTPFSAWTAATPLTLVAPGGSNLAIIDKLGVRVEVQQIRAGRILVRCTGCSGNARNAEGWMPRGVLWGTLPPEQHDIREAKDPLTVVLAARARWAQGKDLPDNASADTMCAMVDQGLSAEASQAIVEVGGGRLRLVRSGANWSVADIEVPNQPVPGSCG